MTWTWIMKRLVGGPRGAGLFDYLASRNRNSSLQDRENARRQAMRDLIARLPAGAVYAEKTPDGWTEIRMPGAPRSSVLVIPVEDSQPQEDPGKPAEIGQPVKALEDDQVTSSPGREIRAPGQDLRSP